MEEIILQLLNVHNVSDVRQIEIHTIEPLVPGPSRLEVKIAVAKLKRFNFPGSNHIPAELFQAGGEILLSTNHKPINSISDQEELPGHCKESIILPVYKLLEIISAGLDVTDQLLIRFSAFVRYWRKNGNTMRQYISYS
jgi:hypothetical protein